MQKKTELLAECVQGFPPDAAAVLVFVADEELVQERVDVLEHGDVVGWGFEEVGCGDGWGRHDGGDGHVWVGDGYLNVLDGR